MLDDGLKTRFWQLVMRWYPAVRHATTPFTPLRVTLAEARVALVTSCGVHLAADAPFDLTDRRGDPSFREIPATADAADLAITHGHYNQRDARLDLNVVFPLARLHELAGEGAIGQVAPWTTASWADPAAGAPDPPHGARGRAPAGRGRRGRGAADALLRCTCNQTVGSDRQGLRGGGPEHLLPVSCARWRRRCGRRARSTSSGRSAARWASPATWRSSAACCSTCSRPPRASSSGTILDLPCPPGGAGKLTTIASQGLRLGGPAAPEWAAGR